MRIKEKIFELLPFVIAFNIFLLAVKYISFENVTLTRVIPAFFAVNIIAILILFILDFKKLKSLFSSVDKRVWILLIVIFFVALSLRVYFAPWTHRIYYDEDIYLNIAQNIVNDGSATLCNRGTPIHCDEGVLNKQPQSVAFILSIFFLFFGPNEALASFIMVLISALTSVAVFFLAYLMTKNEKIALFSALVMALIPIHILWAPTITGETLFSFFATLSFAAILAYLNNRSTKTLFLAALLLAFAAQIRPEAPLILPLAMLFFFKEKLNIKILLAFIVLLIFFSPYVFQFKNISNDTWGSTNGEKLGFSYLKPNSYANSKFFIENTRYPGLFTLFLIPGLFYLIIRKRYLDLLILVGWISLLFGMYASFYAGSFNYGADVRFSNTMYPPIVILIALGIYQLVSIIPTKRKVLVSFAFAIIILAIFAPFLKFVSQVGEEAWDARLSHDFAIETAKRSGNNCYVFSHVPTMFLVNNVASLQTWYATNNAIVDDIFKKTDCVLYEEGYWCVNVETYKNGVCKQLKDNFNLAILGNATERGKTFTMYKMERK